MGEKSVNEKRLHKCMKMIFILTFDMSALNTTSLCFE